MLYLDSDLNFKPEYADASTWEKIGVSGFAAAGVMTLVSCAEAVLRGPRAMKRAAKLCRGWTEGPYNYDEVALGFQDVSKELARMLRLPSPRNLEPLHKTLKEFIEVAGTPEGIADFLHQDDEYVSIMANTTLIAAYSIITAGIMCAGDQVYEENLPDRTLGKLLGFQKFGEIFGWLSVLHPDITAPLGGAVLASVPYLSLDNVLPQHILDRIETACAAVAGDTGLTAPEGRA